MRLCQFGHVDYRHVRTTLLPAISQEHDERKLISPRQIDESNLRTRNDRWWWWKAGLNLEVTAAISRFSSLRAIHYNGTIVKVETKRVSWTYQTCRTDDAVYLFRETWKFLRKKSYIESSSLINLPLKSCNVLEFLLFELNQNMRCIFLWVI